MSSVLKMVLIGAAGVLLFFIGLAVGIVSDSDVRNPMYVGSEPEIEYVPVRVPVPLFVPLPGHAVADEQLGAYRVELPVPLYCFPIEGAGF